MDSEYKVNHKIKVIKECRDNYFPNTSQESLAKAVGVRQATWSEWETGKRDSRAFLAGIRFVILLLLKGARLNDLLSLFPPLETDPDALDSVDNN